MSPSISIGRQHPPFVIAEMSGNHNQSLERAMQIVDAAADAGVDAIKLQTYTADTMTLNVDRDEFRIMDPNSLWYGRHLYELYQEAHTPWAWHKPLFDRCREKGIIGFSTPFDATAVDFLESLDMPLYKIASFENGDTQLIRKIAQTGKPVIASTGMATVADLHQLTSIIREAGNDSLTLLKCTSTYPASPLNTNLRTIPHLRELFQCEVGLSDHTLGIGVAVASVSFGATVIEKHLTLDRSEGGVDAAFSLEPHEMKTMVTELRRAWEAQGDIRYGATEPEKKSMMFRRSVFVVKPVSAGEKITRDHVRIIRPGHGLEPKFYEMIIGRTASQDISAGTPMNWNLLV